MLTDWLQNHIVHIYQTFINGSVDHASPCTTDSADDPRLCNCGPDKATVDRAGRVRRRPGQRRTQDFRLPVWIGRTEVPVF